jgi:hypothetical protein
MRQGTECNSMIAQLLSYFGWCRHNRYSWPQTDKDGNTHVACLDCGKSMPYDLAAMCIVRAR